jgi:hypothetical protein
MVLPRDTQETAMSDMSKEVRELTVEELEVVSGGRIKIQKNPLVTAWEIAKVEAENPGFC